MDNKQKVLEQLKKSGGYVSGQELCERLGVSRTSVWKLINRLREEGYPVEAVTNRGYRLLPMHGADILNEDFLRESLRTEWVGKPLVFYETTKSTNKDIFRLSDEGYPEGTLAVSAEQTGGRGRRGRVWESPPDVNAYMSVLLKPSIPAAQAPSATLVMALAVIDAVNELLQREERKALQENVEAPHVEAGIKWPNDGVLSVNGGPWKKFCGILTEMRMEEMEIRDVVIGIGTNMNQDVFPEELKESATSLKLALGRGIDRAALIAEIWKCFETRYASFIKSGDLRLIKEDYEKYLVNSGRIVRVLDPKEPFTGTAAGITDTGELIVYPEDGSPAREIGTGEISVRGVEGYV